jgi:hypothetical protein
VWSASGAGRAAGVARGGWVVKPPGATVLGLGREGLIYDQTEGDSAGVMVCLRCFNGIPSEWVRRWVRASRRDGAIGEAFCYVCYGWVRVGEADHA